jgi:DNA adenine methylase
MAVRMFPTFPADTRVVLGDMDPGIVGYWRSVLNHPHPFIQRLLDFTPTVDEFYRLKELDGTPSGDELTDGFRKFVLHQMSFSGLGAKAGGPIGGKKQRSDYAVDCRFRPERHALAVAAQHKQLKRFRSVEVVRGDFEESLSRVPADGFAYLDPPYYLQGGALYVHNMTPADHERLSLTLRASRYDWALSYDDHPAVNALYAPWATIQTFSMTATIDTKRGAGNRRKNNELVITPREGRTDADATGA